jgi:hypothetical protein
VANDYGQPFPYTWGTIEGTDVEIIVEFAHPVSPEDAAVVQRIFWDWDQQGVREGYGERLIGEGTGWLHGLYTSETFGPRWSGSTLRWMEDFGSANPSSAADELAGRLSAWSRTSGVPIVRLQFGG